MAIDTGTLLQFIPSFLNLLHGMNNSGQKQTAAQLSNVNNAMVNPNNPLYQQMYGQYKQQGQEQLGENISQMEGQNRMLSAMGRTPLFSPERQGEQAFRAQAAAGPQIGVQAGQQTQGALANAAKSLGGFGGQIGAYGNVAQSQYGNRVQQGAANQVPFALGDLAKFLQSGGSQSLNAPGAQQDNGLAQSLQAKYPNAFGSY